MSCARLAFGVPERCDVWKRYHDGTPGGNDIATAQVVGPDGDQVYVAGKDSGGIGIVAYDAQNGSLLWERSVDVADAHTGARTDLVLADNASRLIVADTVPDDDGSGFLREQDLRILGLDRANGTVQWSTTLDAGNADLAGLVHDPGSDAVLLAGETGQEAFFARLDPGTGSLVWSKEVPIPGPVQVATVAFAPERGSIVAGGWSSSGGPADPVAVAVNGTSGVVEWSQTSGAKDTDLYFDLVVDEPRDRMYAVGWIKGGPWMTLVSARNLSSGAEIWSLQEAAPDGRQQGRSIAVDPQTGHLFVSSQREPNFPGALQIVVHAFTPKGQGLWSHVSQFGTMDYVEPDQTRLAHDGQCLYVMSTSGRRAPPLVDENYEVRTLDASSGQLIDRVLVPGFFSLIEDYGIQLDVVEDEGLVFATGTLRAQDLRSWALGVEGDQGTGGGFDFLTTAIEDPCP